MKIETKGLWSKLLSISVVSVFCLTFLLMAALPGSTALAVTCKFHYKVQAGDTINYVANLYNIGWKKIADANGLSDPFAITPGQTLCIPGGENPNDNNNGSGKVRKNATLQVLGSISDFTVTVANFPGRTVYYVRITPTGGSDSYRVGHFITSKGGDFTGSFPIPYFAKRTRTEQVCVKNAWTDAVSCVKYVDPYYTYFPLQKHCTGSAKDGR